MGVNFLSSSNRAFAFITHAWGDRRFPLLARVLLFLVTVYLFAPVDLLPDGLPFGFVDDLFFIVCIGAIAQTIIPRSVFVDARKAAALGIVFLGVTGTMHSSAPIEAQPISFQLASVRQLGAVRVEKPVMRHDNMPVPKRSANFASMPPVISPPSICRKLHPPDEFYQTILPAATTASRSAGRAIALVTRAGHGKLFGGIESENAEQSRLLSGLAYPFLLSPSCKEGGIFILSVFNNSIWKNYNVA